MQDRPRRNGNLLLGPRALAVISCALALLAAQPALASADAGSRGRAAAVRVSTADFGVEARGAVAAAGLERVRGTSFQRPVRGVATRRLHVLATVEILQRLLAFELRPLEKSVAPALFLAPMGVLVDDVPLSPPYRARVSQTDSFGRGVSVERAFAMARLQLAPPVA